MSSNNLRKLSLCSSICSLLTSACVRWVLFIYLLLIFFRGGVGGLVVVLVSRSQQYSNWPYLSFRNGSPCFGIFYEVLASD